jgi:NTE family protein
VIDFGRLNSGGIRFCLSATDVDAGEAIFFDTAKGDRIEIEHLLASSSLLPAFEPVRIGDRLLADGGLACNLPLEAEIGDARTGAPEPLCFALDLYTAGGGQPFPLNRVIDASVDLFFGMQSRMRLRGLEREWELERQLCEAKSQAPPPAIDLFYMSYHGSEQDAGFGKPFDFSPATMADRMAEGRSAARRALEMRDELAGVSALALRVHDVGRGGAPAAAE